jgi:hypothetical protein
MRVLGKFLASFILLIIVTPVSAAGNYSDTLSPGILGNTTLRWKVTQTPAIPFGLFWMGSGYWIAENNSMMSCTITSLNDDVNGVLVLGDLTSTTNNTDIAKDLTLGVWGATSFLPGLVVKVGNPELSLLNDTAYRSAERDVGNHLNGTMKSSYAQVGAAGAIYECITFTYVQDNTSFGEPQRTYLAYDVMTGVLVKANTSYSFGVRYAFAIELYEILEPLRLLPVAIVGVAVVAVVILVALARKYKR